MNIDHGKREWTSEELDGLREAIDTARLKAGLTRAEVGRQAQVAGSTFSQFMSADYKGDNSKIASDLTKWLDAHHASLEFRLKAPPEPSFVQTSGATKVHAALQQAQLLNDTAVIVGPPGAGKTAALKQYKARTPRVYIVTGSPSISTAPAVLGDFINHHVPDENHMSIRSLAGRSAVVRRILTRGSLLILDEAQHLAMGALEELRSIQDENRCGLALVGNPTVLRRLQGASRDPAYAQLFGRVGWRVVLPKATEGDVAAVLDTMGVTAAEVIKIGFEILKKEDMRVVVKTTRSAMLLASGNNENLEAKHIRAAYRQLAGEAVAA